MPLSTGSENHYIKRRPLWMPSVALLAICLSAAPVLAQANDTAGTRSSVATQEARKSSADPKEKEIIATAPSDLDRSLDILGVVATLIGVLVGVLTLIFVVGGALGFAEFFRLRNIRRDIARMRDRIQKACKEAEEAAEEARPILKGLKKTREEVSRISKKTKAAQLIETPSEELERTLAEYGKKIELLEAFGLPLEADDYVTRGIELMHGEDCAIALTAFEKAIGLNPNHPVAWSGRGIMLDRLGRLEEALKSQDRAIELDARVSVPWFAKGATLDHLGRYEEALKAFDRAIELEPDYTRAWCDRGVVLSKLGRYEEALKAFDRAIELEPDYTRAWCDRGVALSKLGRNEEALKAFNRAIELEPDGFAAASYDKACCHSLKGEKKKALHSLSRAVELNTRYKEDARSEEDFKDLRDDEEFKKIVS